MLLDNIFNVPKKIEVFIKIKDGQVEYKTKHAPMTIQHDNSEKPFFPISKIRK